jgi:hypothetical protein
MVHRPVAERAQHNASLSPDGSEPGRAPPCSACATWSGLHLIRFGLDGLGDRVVDQDDVAGVDQIETVGAHLLCSCRSSSAFCARNSSANAK